MPEIKARKSFKREVLLAEKRGFDMSELRTVVETLRKGERLHEKYRDHMLEDSRNYKGCRECHIKGDRLLVYKLHKDVLILESVRTATCFEKQHNKRKTTLPGNA